MTVVVEYYEYEKPYGHFDKVDYNKRHTIKFSGDKASEIMPEIRYLSEHHDLYRYTPTKIVDILD